MRTSLLLINEINLGTRLNQAVVDHRRGEFGLLLAMMSNDARDMAQFHIAQAGQDTQQKLRQKFELPAAEVLIANYDQDNPTDNSQAFHQSGMCHFHLQQYLRPEGLVTRGEEALDMVSVFANCDPVTKARHRGELGDDTYQVEIPHFSDQIVAQRALGNILV